MSLTDQRMPPPRLIATDLDGTLLRPDGTISTRTLAALHAVTARGAEVVFVTARPPRQLEAFTGHTWVPATAVCSNGAIAYDLGTRNYLEVRELAVPLVRRAVEALSSVLPQVGFAVDTGRRAFDEPGYGWTCPDDRAEVRTLTRAIDDLWTHGEPIVKLLAWSAELDTDALFALATETLGKEVEITFSGANGPLEISPPGVTKASGLASLCAAREVDPREVIAFGDMPNDLSILHWAGTGYAMANSHPSVLSAVPLHTAANTEDGVALVLESLFSAPGEP